MLHYTILYNKAYYNTTCYTITCYDILQQNPELLEGGP